MKKTRSRVIKFLFRFQVREQLKRLDENPIRKPIETRVKKKFFSRLNWRGKTKGVEGGRDFRFRYLLSTKHFPDSSFVFSTVAGSYFSLFVSAPKWALMYCDLVILHVFLPRRSVSLTAAAATTPHPTSRRSNTFLLQYYKYSSGGRDSVRKRKKLLACDSALRC